MEKIRYVLVLVLLLPITLFAGEREFDETKYVFQSLNPKPMDDPYVECDWAIPALALPLLGGTTADLYTLQTSESSGRVVEARKKVGTLTGCWDEGQNILDNGSPSYMVGMVFWLVTDDLALFANGSQIIRTEPGFPQSTPEFGLRDMTLWSSGNTVWREIDGSPGEWEQIGSMTANHHTNPAGITGYEGGSIITLRLFEPRDYVQEAILEAWKRMPGGE